MKKALLILLVFVIGVIPNLVIPGLAVYADSALRVNVIQSSNEGLSLEVIVPWQQLELQEQVFDGKHYLKTVLPGFSYTSREGTPELPVMLESLGIPFGATLDVNVKPGKAHKQLVSAPILPVETELVAKNFLGEKQVLADAFTVQSSLIENKEIYKASSPYPAKLAEVSQVATVRQQRIAALQLFPVQYQPALNTLIIYESLYVEIKFSGLKNSEGRTDYEAESSVYEQFFRDTLLNYETAKSWRQIIEEQENELALGRSIPWSPPNPAWRLNVRQDGMYRLTYEVLEEAQVHVEGLDPSTFQMFHLGSEIAIEVDSISEDQFAPGDSIIFYGEALKDKYTLDNAYWLTYGLAPGLRMEIVDGTPHSSLAAEAYPESITVEENKNYINYIPAEDDFEHFLGQFIYPPGYASRTITFNLDNLLDGSGILMLALLGYLNVPYHHASITLNGVELAADIQWDAFTWKNIEMNLPSGSLAEGTNTLIISTANLKDLFYIDFVSLEFPRSFVAVNDKLSYHFEETGTWLFNLQNFTSTDLFLFDLSDPNLVKKFTNYSILTSDNTSTLQFETEISSARGFWAGSSANFLTVESITQDVGSNWQSSANGADYIVITHQDFITQANLLADYRETQGLRTAVVNVQDIYDEFGYGITGSQPIRAFLSYAYAHWESPAPSYVVLIGDGHFDPKNYMGYGRQSFIPPYLAMADPELGETAADNRYVAFIGEDIFPDMMLGRLAVNTTNEAQGFVDKIIAYEETPEPADWKKQVLAVSDKYGTWPFPYTSDELLRCCLPSSYEPVRVYLEVTHPDVSEARAAIIAEINAGKILVNYIGHAAVSQWSAPNPGMLNVQNISSLSNINKYPVILSMTCWDGYYVYPNPTGGFYEAMAEVYTKASNKGAVAAWSATGMGVARGHEYLSQGFYNAIFRNGFTNLGQATNYGKLYLWTSTENLDLMDTYLLFGDPATNIMHYKKVFLPVILK